jgi:hypothetical protein
VPGQPKRVVVPVDTVWAVTDTVLLRLDRATAAALPAFREEDVMPAPAEWAPPLDYRRTDVRLTTASAASEQTTPFPTTT